MSYRILITVTIAMMLATSGLLWRTWNLPSGQTILKFDERLTALETGLHHTAAPDTAQPTNTNKLNSGWAQELGMQVSKLEAKLQMLAKQIAETQAQQTNPDTGEYSDLPQEQVHNPDEESADQPQPFAAVLTKLDDRHSLQSVDSVWAESVEKDLWAAYEQSPMREQVGLNTIDCRSDMCTLDFSLAPVEGEMLPTHEVEEWVFTNADDCAYVIEAPYSDDDPDVGATQRVILHNCK